MDNKVKDIIYLHNVMELYLNIYNGDHEGFKLYIQEFITKYC